jgi:hypothetical protein
VPFECRKGFGTDVMLDAFGIHFGDAFGNSEAAQESDDGIVPTFAGGGEGSAFFGQKNGTIWLGSHQAGMLQASDGAIDGDVSNAEAFGEVNDAGFTGFGNEVGDGFDVILSNFVGVLAAGLREVLGLSFTGGVRVF